MNQASCSATVHTLPATKTRTVISRTGNDEARGRKYLTRDEVRRLVKQARKNRHGARDALMIRMAFEHGLRVSELVSIKWQHINMDAGDISIERSKGSISGTHPLQGQTLRELRKMGRVTGRSQGFVFVNERGSPVSVDGFRKTLHRLSEDVFGVRWNPHALRHACGYHMINEGVDIRTAQQYLGHSNIQNTVTYTAMSSRAFSKLRF